MGSVAPSQWSLIGQDISAWMRKIPLDPHIIAQSLQDQCNGPPTSVAEDMEFSDDSADEMAEAGEPEEPCFMSDGSRQSLTCSFNLKWKTSTLLKALSMTSSAGT